MGNLMPWHLTQLTDIDYNRVDLVKEGANSQAHIKLFKSRGGVSMDIKEILAKMKPEHSAIIEKALSEKDEQIVLLQKAADDAKKAADDLAVAASSSNNADDEDDVMKNVKDPAVRKVLETQIAKAKAAEEVVKQMKGLQDTQDAITKAKEVPNLGADEAKMAEVYKKLKNTDTQLCDDVFGIFKAASALVAQGGVFQEIGKGAGNQDVTGDEKSAWDTIEKAADEVVKSRNIKKSAAIAAVIKERPELYKAYMDAQNRA